MVPFVSPKPSPTTAMSSLNKTSATTSFLKQHIEDTRKEVRLSFVDLNVERPSLSVFVACRLDGLVGGNLETVPPERGTRFVQGIATTAAPTHGTAGTVNVARATLPTAGQFPRI